MKTKEEIKRQSSFCFQMAKDLARDEKEAPEANYYSGAWHALAWVLGEEVEI